MTNGWALDGVLWFAVFATVFFAALIRALTGWAFSILCVPLLSLCLDPSTAIVLTLLLALAATGKNLKGIGSQVQKGTFVPILVSGMLGVPLGYGIHQGLPTATLRLMMGFLVVALSLAMALIRSHPRPMSRGWLLAAGLASGVMGGLFGIAGPPVVLLFLATATDMREARATLGLGLFVVSGLAVLFYSVGGYVDGHVLLLALLALPAVLGGDTLGNRLFNRFPKLAFKGLSVAVTCGVGLVNLGLAFRG
jgi:uncharacterized membrane protein YfcA